MSRASVTYRRSELRGMFWADCPNCHETCVIAETPDGPARLDTVTDGGGPGETSYEPHDCPAEREDS